MTIGNKQAGPQQQMFPRAADWCITEGLMILLGFKTPHMYQASGLWWDGE